MKTLFFLFTGILLLNCSNGDNNINLESFLNDCSNDENLKDREVIANFTDETGFIVGPENDCANIFTIKGGPDVDGRNVELLAPCNLGEAFEQDGLKILFSGHLYETFETENICAQIFELTKIEKQP